MSYIPEQVVIDLINTAGAEILDLNTSNYYKAVDYPFDKSGTTFSDSNLMDYANFWGDNSCVITQGASTLNSVYVSTTRAGTLVIGFATISAGVATIVATSTQVIGAAGIYSFTLAQLGNPNLSAYPTYYVVIRNSTSGTRCVNYGTGGGFSSFFFPVAGGSVTQNSADQISYWIQSEVNNAFALPIAIQGCSTYLQIIQSLALYNYAFINEGTIIIPATINLLAGQKIVGKGFNSILTPGAGVTICLYADIQSNVQISNLAIIGTDPAIDITSSSIVPTIASIDTNTGIGTNYAIFLLECDGSIVENVLITNFNADGILIRTVGYQSGNNFFNGVKLDKIFLNDCYRGLHIDTTAEYSQFSNITSRNCLCGITIRGGNNHITNSHFTACRIGLHMSGTGAVNNAHGFLSNISANHAFLIGVYLYDITNGQMINGLTVFYVGVLVDTCQGVMWNGGQFGATAIITHQNATGINAFHNLMFTATTSHFTLTGTAPDLKNNLYLDGSSTAGINN